MAFDSSEFRRTLERMGKGQDHGLTPAQPAFDPYVHREMAADAIQGRKIGDYMQALEACGFSFVPAARLRPYADGRRHEHGEWRNDAWNVAFTEQDVLAYFPDGAGEFYQWFQKHQLQVRAARSRLLVP